MQTQQSNAIRQSSLQRNSPLLATGLSIICPGLGAAYNGNNSKALVHFAVFVALFQMAVLTSGTPLFVLGFLGAWLFAIVDSWRTARAIKLGQTTSSDDLLTRKLSNNPLVWGISLIGLGTLFFLSTVFEIRLPMRQILPVLLIGFGVYWLINFFQSNRNKQFTELQNDNFGSFASTDNVVAIDSATQFQSDKFSG